MIQLNNVSKKYAGKSVISQVSCDIAQGILHISGDNGSGKTTLLNMMAGSLVPDEGKILYSGSDIYDKKSYRIKNAIGYIPDSAPIYPFLSGNDFLKFICKVKQSKWPFELIGSLNLEKHLNTNFLSMSYGTKIKFLCIAGMIGNPHYLLLDEPMNGLDEDAKEVMFHLLTKHLNSDEGICVMVSHDLSWIDKWREKFNYCLLEIRT